MKYLTFYVPMFQQSTKSYTSKPCVSFILLLLLYSSVLTAQYSKPATELPKLVESTGLTVETAQGELRGSFENSRSDPISRSASSPKIRVFKGIPFAEPPTGPMRWRPPEKLNVWQGVREATRFGSSCMQGVRPSSAESSISEDCLYLNVWSPVLSRDLKPLPVMVWIHGGGFVVGSGDMDAARLAAKGVVIVTFNYRLGVFGFLAHPALTAESEHHASGNYGLMDQIAALHWVQQNIGAFGGDSAQVTVFGESAGGTSIGYLLASPLAHGLFARAILESPSRLFLPDPKLTVPYAGLPSMESIGSAIDPSIAHLRQLSSWAVMKQAAAVTNSLFAAGSPERIGLRPESHVHDPRNHDSPWWAFADGYVIPQPLIELYKEGREAAVPVMLGTNANEGSMFLHKFPIDTHAAYRGYLRDNYHPCSDELLAVYPAESSVQIREAVEHIITDAFFVYGVQFAATSLSQRNPSVYVYRFTRVSPKGLITGDGAWHGSEVAYVFGQSTPTIAPDLYREQDARLSGMMMDAWVRFASSGDPSERSIPWPAWRPNERYYLDFGDSISVHQLEDMIRFRIFAQIFSPQLSATCQMHSPQIESFADPQGMNSQSHSSALWSEPPRLK